MAKNKMEQQWQAEEDARTLARYQEIMNDSKRRNKAISTARSQAADLEKRAASMRKAASSKK